MTAYVQFGRDRRRTCQILIVALSLDRLRQMSDVAASDAPHGDPTRL